MPITVCKSSLYVVFALVALVVQADNDMQLAHIQAAHPGEHICDGHRGSIFDDDASCSNAKELSGLSLLQVDTSKFDIGSKGELAPAMGGVSLQQSEMPEETVQQHSRFSGLLQSSFYQDVIAQLRAGKSS